MNEHELNSIEKIKEQAVKTVLSIWNGKRFDHFKLHVAGILFAYSRIRIFVP